MLNKESLINDLKKLHQEIFFTYEKIFEYKFLKDSKFKTLIEEEYKKENLSSEDEKNLWNEKFIHRSAYTLLNKFLFIRICEDKGFMMNDEDKVMGEEVNKNAGKKLSMVGLQKWSDLISNYSLSELIKFSFRDMSRSYSNLPLYKEDKYDWLIPTKNEIEIILLNPKKETEELPFQEFEILIKKVIETLDISKYNFDESSDTVLGDVYEKFMDRETRKALGQFYTPEFVIKYILENTVANVNILENPFVKVFDPSCGSGHFLIMAYDLLKEKFINSLSQLQRKYRNEKYEIKEGIKSKIIDGQEYWNKKYLHYHILRHCIYGADIDGFALQLTTINLLLKDLDNVFIDELNIIECDSLIKWEDDVNWKELREQLKTEGLFLNAQYRDLQGVLKEELLSLDQAFEFIKKGAIWNQKYDYIIGNPPWISLSGKHEQSIDYKLLHYYTEAHGGNTYMPNLYEFFIRRMLKKVSKNGMFSFVIPDRFAENGQFKDLRKTILEEFTINNLIFEVKFPDVIADAMIFVITNRTEDGNEVVIGNLETSYLVDQVEFNDGENFPFKFYKDQTFKNLINKIKKSSIKLGDICDTTSGFGGKSTEITEERKSPEQIKVLKGDSIERYGVRKNYYFEFKRENITGRTTDKNKLGADKKILIRKTGDTIIACYDDSKIFPEQSLYFVFNLNKTFNSFYILGLLNSKLINFYYMNDLLTNRNSTAQVKKVDLDNIPIFEVPLNEQQVIVSFVEQIVDIWNQLKNFDFFLKKDQKTMLSRGIEYEELLGHLHTLQFELDNEIISMYGLEKEEIDFINKDFSIKNSEYCLFKKLVTSNDEFQKELSQLTQKEIAKKYETEVAFVSRLRTEIISSNPLLHEDISAFYNLEALHDSIKKLIVQKVKMFFSNSKKYLTLNEIKNMCEKDIENFSNMIKVLKGEDQTVKSEKIVKEILNSYSSTVSNYLKQKNNNIFIKYDRDFYGLWEWDDEIHKTFFVDFITYQTSKNAEDNSVFKDIKRDEKKSKTALNLLKQLDFMDREDYIELLSENINKAFR